MVLGGGRVLIRVTPSFPLGEGLVFLHESPTDRQVLLVLASTFLRFPASPGQRGAAAYARLPVLG